LNIFVKNSVLLLAQIRGSSHPTAAQSAVRIATKPTLLIPVNLQDLLPLTGPPLTNMASLEAGIDIDALALAKPCIACRKRKVKCSKTRPCSNCARAKQLCNYDGDEPGPDTARQSIEGSADGEVRERLARLEKLMEMMMVRESGGVATRWSPEIAAAGSVAAAKDPLSRLTHKPSLSPSLSQSSHQNTAPAVGASDAPLGQILFQELHSAYFDSDFWAGLVTEVDSNTLEPFENFTNRSSHPDRGPETIV
jgi:Fungal Zn(2)-Cys(6) binuclear cluster domain